MEKIIDSPYIKCTTYEPDDPFDMAESLCNRFDGVHLGDLKDILGSLDMYKALTEFGKQMLIRLRAKAEGTIRYNFRKPEEFEAAIIAHDAWKKKNGMEINPFDMERVRLYNESREWKNEFGDLERNAERERLKDIFFTCANMKEEQSCGGKVRFSNFGWDGRNGAEKSFRVFRCEKCHACYYQDKRYPISSYDKLVPAEINSQIEQITK